MNFEGINFVFHIGSSDGRENFPHSSPSRNWQSNQPWKLPTQRCELKLAKGNQPWNCPCSGPSRNWQRVTSRENCPRSGPSRNWQRVGLTSRENCPRSGPSRNWQRVTGRENCPTNYFWSRMEPWIPGTVCLEAAWMNKLPVLELERYPYQLFIGSSIDPYIPGTSCLISCMDPRIPGTGCLGCYMCP